MARKTFTVLGMTSAVLIFGMATARAQNYPWCAARSDGSRSCGYSSYEQCVANAARGSCERNFMYQAPSGAARPRRSPR